MFTKRWLPLLLFVCVLVVGFRVYDFFSTPQDVHHLTGTVSSLPTVSGDQLTFTVSNRTVKARRVSLNIGDEVSLEGDLRNNVFYAQKVTLNQQSQLTRSLVSLRADLFQKIKDNFPQPQSSLLVGVLLGIKTDLSQDFKNSLIKIV